MFSSRQIQNISSHFITLHKCTNIFYSAKIKLKVKLMTRLEQLQKMNSEDPNDVFVFYALTKEYEYNGMEDLALDHYQQLMDQHPDYVGLYYHFGKLLEKHGRQEEALSVYDAGLAVAKQQNDLFAHGELSNARTNLDMEM
jgi:tetratricopeptide (TPR) repeat protein